MSAEILGVMITVQCDKCDGAGSLHEPSMSADFISANFVYAICPCCKGSGHMQKEVSLNELRKAFAALGQH